MEVKTLESVGFQSLDLMMMMMMLNMDMGHLEISIWRVKESLLSGQEDGIKEVIYVIMLLLTLLTKVHHKLGSMMID